MWIIKTNINTNCQEQLMWKGSAILSNFFFFCSRLVTDGTTNLLLGNHTNMLLVYQDVTLKWAAQLPFVPVAVRIANFLWVPPPAKHSIWCHSFLWDKFKNLLRVLTVEQWNHDSFLWNPFIKESLLKPPGSIGYYYKVICSIQSTWNKRTKLVLLLNFPGDSCVSMVGNIS